MVGDKKTLPFWSRRRPNLVMQERALKARRAGGERHTNAEHVVIGRKLAQHRFAVSKGRIHSPG